MNVFVSNSEGQDVSVFLKNGTQGKYWLYQEIDIPAVDNLKVRIVLLHISYCFGVFDSQASTNLKQNVYQYIFRRRIYDNKKLKDKQHSDSSFI